MEYGPAQLGAPAAYSATQPDTRPLESISLAVSRVNSAQVRISRFIDRFHGEGPKEQGSVGGGEQIAPPSPHGVNLQRLFEALERLEQRVEALDQIG